MKNYRSITPAHYWRMMFAIWVVRLSIVWNVKTWLIDHGLGRLTR